MTSTLDISQEQRATLLALLHHHLPGVTIWAYGSRVKGSARPNSDLDLVVFTTPAQRPQVSDLKDALDESNIPFRVDLHAWHDIPERFHDVIRNEYQVLSDTSSPR